MQLYPNLNITVTEGGLFKPAHSVEWSTKNHTAVMNKFYFITDGRCKITIEGNSYTATRGDWFFIPAGTPHSYSNFPGEKFSKYWLHFYLNPPKDLVKLFDIDYLIKLKGNSKVEDIFVRANKLIHAKSFADKLLLNAAALELLSAFIRLSDKGAANLKPDEMFDNLSEINEYVEENIDRKISNEELAAIVHMHPTHFIRYFKKETGQTPGDYVNKRKLEYAANLLVNTELSMLEIAYRLGFFDATHFSKAFKKRYSISPSAYRKNYSR
ncbi:MAG: helix-turn-helix domain-containing protein [Clostridia bacterium]|nr:helix-turn-helix domain-containing protein [Clostridia bacterium]